jgi:hypothetical protein
LPSVAREDALSADYSLQLALGWDNYRRWRKEQAEASAKGVAQTLAGSTPGKAVKLKDVAFTCHPSQSGAERKDDGHDDDQED